MPSTPSWIATWLTGMRNAAHNRTAIVVKPKGSGLSGQYAANSTPTNTTDCKPASKGRPTARQRQSTSAMGVNTSRALACEGYRANTVATGSAPANIQAVAEPTIVTTSAPTATARMKRPAERTDRIVA